MPETLHWVRAPIRAGCISPRVRGRFHGGHAEETHAPGRACYAGSPAPRGSGLCLLWARSPEARRPGRGGTGREPWRGDARLLSDATLPGSQAASEVELKTQLSACSVLLMLSPSSDQEPPIPSSHLRGDLNSLAPLSLRLSS